ncbi:glutaredoxin 2 [Marinomonas sp.]|uniref:glutaredoxin 2 n=1 Tax=Marinomonas sp. TaxID=1904862 RepID=UPI003C751FBC
MKLYQYHHCPFCVRVDMIANYKEIPHEKVYLLNDDEETCLTLTNAKKAPILEHSDGTTLSDNLLIAKHLDTIGDPRKIIRGEANSINQPSPLKEVEQAIRCLVFPRIILLGLPEFATQSARDHFQSKKEKDLQQSFENALLDSSKYKKQVEQALNALPPLSLPSDHNNTISWDDILLFPILRSLTMVSGLLFPEPIQRYLEEVSRITSIHTYTDFEI